MDTTCQENIWEIYGLKNNPFSTSPILVNEGFLPLEAFVGREEEIKRLNTILRMGDGTRTIVTGDTGVGKTTLVNFIRGNAIKTRKFFTHLKEIEVGDNWTTNDFIAHTLSNIYNTINRVELEGFPESLKKRLSYLFDIIEINNSGFSFNVLGNGIGYNNSKQSNQPKITTELLKSLFKATIEEITKLGFEQVILHYNNLENISKEKLIRLFVGLRDFLQNEKVHFIFVGGEPFPSAIYEEDKVRSIFVYGNIELPIFKYEEILEILERRMKYLAFENMKIFKPYENNAIKELNKIHEGNIRDILNSLSVAMIELICKTPNDPVLLTKNKVRGILKDILKKRYLSRISETDTLVLKEILRLGETTNTEIAKNLGKLKQNISKNIKKLRRLKAIKIKKIGVEKIIKVSAEIKWMNLEEEVKPKKEIIEKKTETNTQRLLDGWTGQN